MQLLILLSRLLLLLQLLVSSIVQYEWAIIVQIPIVCHNHIIFTFHQILINIRLAIKKTTIVIMRRKRKMIGITIAIAVMSGQS